MPAIQLVFDQPQSGLPAQLLFGATPNSGTPPTPVEEATPHFFVSARIVHRHQDARAATTTTKHRQQQAQPLIRTAQHRQQTALKARRTTTHHNASAQLKTRTAAHHHQDALLPNPRSVLHRHQDAQALFAQTSSHWQDARIIATSTTTRWQDCLRPIRTLAVHWQNAQNTAKTMRAWSANALLLNARFTVRWQDALRASGGLYVPPPPPPQPPCWQANANGYVPLLFQQPYSDAMPAGLVFACFSKERQLATEANAYFLPFLYYLTVADCYAKLDDGRDLEVFSCDLSADVGSYGWSLSLTTSGGWFDELRKPNAPKLINVWLQGEKWTFLIEGLGRTRGAPKKRTSIKGVSQAALLGSLGSKKSIEQNNARNAQQLALGFLSGTGFNLEWSLTDWLVPANTIVDTDYPLSLSIAMAEAVGGYVHSHQTDKAIKYDSLFSTPPWEWASRSADVSVPHNFVLTDSFSERSRPIKNGIYVQGEKNGILRQIIRHGTQGDKQAEPVVNRYITANEAAQQRGVAELSKHGRWNLIDLSLPVLPLTNKFLKLGNFIQVQEETPWKGVVTGVNISYSQPKIRQKVRVEQYVQ